jgi:hypothetical protein
MDGVLGLSPWMKKGTLVECVGDTPSIPPQTIPNGMSVEDKDGGRDGDSPRVITHIHIHSLVAPPSKEIQSVIKEEGRVCETRETVDASLKLTGSVCVESPLITTHTLTRGQTGLTRRLQSRTPLGDTGTSHPGGGGRVSVDKDGDYSVHSATLAHRTREQSSTKKFTHTLPPSSSSSSER